MGRHLQLFFGGGLGDVIYHVYEGGKYLLLEQMDVDDRATVYLSCSNPFAREIFDYHPKATQIEVRNHHWWPWEVDEEMRAKYQIPQRWEIPIYEGVHGETNFRHSPTDQEKLDLLEGKPYIVIAATAGTPDRSIPLPMVSMLVQDLTDLGYWTVLVGRTYERQGRNEIRLGSESLKEKPHTWDLVDKLTVPGTINLVKKAQGLVTAHSALVMLTNLIRPQPETLLLTTHAVYQRHLLPRDRWGEIIYSERTTFAASEEPYHDSERKVLAYLEKMWRHYVLLGGPPKFKYRFPES